MGMSSSQARLLSLTARQHDVEWKAQKLQAEKLQMANDSDRVYNTYLEALNKTKIQARISDKWEGDTFKDATLAMLENGLIPENSPHYKPGEYAANPLFLQDIETGKIIITDDYAKANGITENNTFTGSLEDWLIMKGAPTKEEQYIKDYIVTEDKTKVTGFTAVANTSFSKFSYNYTYAPVANSAGGVDYEALKGFTEFDDTHNTVNGTALANATALTAGQTYTVSNKNDLNKLLELANAGADTTGVNIVMTGDVDMSGVNWTGIKDFKGTFDGNGYKISNLTGTQGLFASTKGATIKNVGLENVNINGTASSVGGLVGSSGTGTNISNAYTTGTVKSTGNNVGGLVGYHTDTGVFSDVYSSANTSGADNVGGLIGNMHCSPSDVFDLKDCYAIGNVNGNNNVGGLAGNMYYDEDSRGADITDIVNAYSGGNVTGKENVGGFVGSFLYWGDGGDYCYIEKCQSTGKVNGTTNVGAFAGEITVKLDAGAGWDSEDQKYVNFKDSGFANNTGAADGFGIIVDTAGNDVTDLVTSSGSTGGLTEFQVAAKTPSVTGMASNILAALIKAGVYDPYTATADETAEWERKITNYINQFADNKTDNQKLYYLNNTIVGYLNAGAPNANQQNFANSLVTDIQNGTTTSTANWQQGADIGTIKRENTDQSWDATLNKTDGKLIVAHTNTIAANLLAAGQRAGSPITEEKIKAFLAQYDTTDAQDLAYLGYLNDLVVDYAKNDNYAVVEDVIKAVEGTYRFEQMDPAIDDINNYKVSMGSDQSGNVKVTYGTTSTPVWDKRTVIDYDHPKTQQLIKDYYAQLQGYIIIGNDADEAGLCDSSEWLTNMINNGLAQFLTYDYDEVTKIATPRGVSVADEISLQEVPDKTYLNAAEATYEKDMKKINKKETKIDTELQQLEAERTSIKTEQDDLKKVIKDNVDLTFKLFS